jgi:hypothetical protein
MVRKQKSNEPKKKSPWTPIMARVADREGICHLCEKTMKSGEMIFYFPTIKEYGDEGPGTVYCLDCYMKKLIDLSVMEVL